MLQFSSVTQLCPTLCDPMNQSMPGLPVHSGVHPNPCPLSQWCHLTISSSVVPFSCCAQSFPASGSFYCSYNFSISPSNEYSGLLFFRIDWFDLLAVQGTLRSLVQHHSLKATILRRSAFFMVRLSHPYMTTGKTIALTRWAFVGSDVSAF